MITAPVAGFMSKVPNWVTMTPGLFKSVASDGRSVNSTSPFKSLPMVMLKGWPEAMVKVGEKLIAHGALKVPNRVKRCRTSLEVRPYSDEKSYGLAAKVPDPSVSLFALPKE